MFENRESEQSYQPSDIELPRGVLSRSVPHRKSLALALARALALAPALAVAVAISRGAGPPARPFGSWPAAAAAAGPALALLPGGRVRLRADLK